MKTLLNLTLALGLWASTTGCTHATPPATVQEKIKHGARVVDVRTPAEYATGHYPGATNIPLAEIPNRLADFGPQDKPIVLYCRSGNRSGQAQRLLQQAGFTDVTNAGGLSDLQK
jgi:phage shock protein E